MLTSPANWLLSGLPADVQNRLLHHLERVHLSTGTVLYESASPIRHVYFPTEAVVSFSNATVNGSSAQTSLVGQEGVVGISTFMGGDSATSRAVVQIAGTAYRIPVGRAKEEFARHGEFCMRMLRYSQAILTQTAQTVACNRHHTIDQQLCRWLLLLLDRLPTHDVLMTQDAIAHMLGVRREGVTEAAGRLRKKGIVTCTRGRFVVRDRVRLEARSCECYAVVKTESDRLLTPAYIEALKRRSDSSRTTA